MTQQKIFLISYFVLIAFILFSGCTSENENKDHAVTLHFKDANGKPATGAPVWTVYNSNITDENGNVIFTLAGDFPYDIKILYQDTETTYYKTVTPGKYYEFTVITMQIPKCAIETHNTTYTSDGRWTSVFGIVNNTGANGNCKVYFELFTGNVWDDDRNQTPIETKNETLYIAGGKKQPFTFNIDNPSIPTHSYRVWSVRA